MNRTDFDIELGVTKEITRFNGYDDNVIWKLVQNQKWVKNIRSTSILTAEGERKIVISPIL